MKYGVLGTGDVARTISSKLIELGHRVMMGLERQRMRKPSIGRRKTEKMQHVGLLLM